MPGLIGFAWGAAMFHKEIIMDVGAVFAGCRCWGCSQGSAVFLDGFMRGLAQSKMIGGVG